jgi:hypothetical protein
MNDLVLAPGEEKQLTLSVVPLSLGSCALPRLRIFEKELNGENDEEVRVKEWNMLVESQVEVILSKDQMKLERELSVARGSDGAIAQPMIKSYVLPR